jgi:hypothetical protein
MITCIYKWHLKKTACNPAGPAENHLWLNLAGDLAHWERVSLSAQHNRLAPASMPRYSYSVNCTASNGTRLARCSADETLGIHGF